MILWIFFFRTLSPLFSIKKAVDYCMLTLFDRKELVIFSFYVVYKSAVPTIHLWHLFLKNTLILGIMRLDLLWVSCLV